MKLQGLGVAAGHIEEPAYRPTVIPPKISGVQK